MLILITTKEEENFALYLKTDVCRLIYTGTEFRFESMLDKLITLKDFLINFGIQEIELRDYKNGGGALIIHEELKMYLEDKTTIRGLSVPVFTLI